MQSLWALNTLRTLNSLGSARSYFLKRFFLLTKRHWHCLYAIHEHFLGKVFHFGCGIVVKRPGMAEFGRGISLALTLTCGSSPDKNPRWFLNRPKCGMIESVPDTPGSLLIIILSGLPLPRTFIVCGLMSASRISLGASGRLGTFKREEKRAGEVLFVSSWTAAYLLPLVVIVAQSVQTSEFICPRAAGERGQARA